MTHDELREAVARAMCDAVNVTGTWDETGTLHREKVWFPAADAAIALIRPAVLEAAAKVWDMIEEYADRKARKMYNGDIWLGESQGCGKAAAAIRALKEKP